MVAILDGHVLERIERKSVKSWLMSFVGASSFILSSFSMFEITIVVSHYAYTL
jgi:hypothetical protein